ncbi:MAG: MFS transporter [Nocardioidaceae bacterium]
MSRPPAAVSYRAVLTLPHARSTFAAAVVGRVSYGTLPLALLFVTQQATHSYGVAGAVLAVFGLATVTAPAKSRLMDRHGQRTLLIVLGVGYPLALATYTGLTLQPDPRPGLLLGVAAVAGCLTPPLGPAMRALWAEMAPNPALKQRAYSLDSVVEESLYAVGPLLVSLVLTVADARAALLLTACLVAAGTIGLALSTVSATMAPHRRPQRAPALTTRPDRLGPLAAPGMWPVLVAILGAGAGLGVLEVAVPARASAEGGPATAGYLMAALAVGSAAGGIVWGRRHHTGARVRQLTVLLLLMGVGLATCAWVSELAVLAALLLVLGSMIAPAFIVSYLAVDEIAPEHQRTEATTWVNTVSNLGVSASTALAGFLVDRADLWVTFGCGAMLLLGAAAGTTAVRRLGVTF